MQPTVAYQMSLFPTEAEQIAYIDTAESVNPTPSAFSMFISQDDIDHILRAGGNADAARMRIAAEFSKQKSLEERAAFLKNLYYGGNGLITESGRVSAWYGDDGIHIANGSAARHLSSAQVISWPDAAARVEALLDSGTFATELEVTEAPRYERLRIAVDVWNLYHDFSDGAKSLGYLSCLGNIHSTSFPEESERLIDALASPEFRERLLPEFKAFVDAYRENRELLRFHFHRPQALLARLEDLSLPRKEYRSDMMKVPETGSFITEDEIAACLAGGSSFEGGKGRIYAFFQTAHTPRESVDFLKKEYGIGGHTHAVSRASGSYEDHSAKGITLKKAGCEDVRLNWNKVASRISELIRLNRYLTPEEQARFDKEQAQEKSHDVDDTPPAADAQQPTVAELFEQYKLTVGNALAEDEAFVNACRNSDRENAYLEGAAAIRRIVYASDDLQLAKLYFDMPTFHNRLHQELLDELYPALATTVTPSPYKVTQADIDEALQQWNGKIESKHAVIRYMAQHGREKDTAAWLAREYGLQDISKPLQISVGNSEPAVLPWAKVQRRIAQLIKADKFYTQAEHDNYDDIDPIALREALAQRGIVGGRIVDAEANRNSPFVRQVMADVERIAAQEAQKEPSIDPADRFHVVSLDRGFRTLYTVWDDETHGYYVDADGVTEEC